eukprot:CAMPEP_0195514958 /NCGR_PEP_ID=MMETSP0794_2-20130614/6185_1 /TAXON_ID=515487 /ORGANISM="Stephanopyxis turris, Strain CCMP 815" /LENGTH=237 /DNA_ID=CAMNT_0040643319 /DNA_START=218 /DNA_END=931 /DNA_ORIENTATION=-
MPLTCSSFSSSEESNYLPKSLSHHFQPFVSALGSNVNLSGSFMRGMRGNSTYTVHRMFSATARNTEGEKRGSGSVPPVQNEKKSPMLKIKASANKGIKNAKEGYATGAIRVKDLWKKYGVLAMGTYASLYFGTVGGLFICIDSGIIDPSTLVNLFGGGEGDVVASGGEEGGGGIVKLLTDYLEKFDFTRPYVEKIEKNPQLINLGVAWIAAKFTEPIRLGLTVVIVPRLARFLRKET